jgi:hypothetical protein
MSMNPTTGPLLLDKHRDMLKTATKFKCNACSQIGDSPKAQGPFLWKPANKMTKRLAGGRAATYVLCEECANLSDEVTRPKIEASLAQYGLFG